MKEIKRYIMKHIFYEDFGSLLDDYKEAATRDDKLIKHKLDSIVALYDACELKEREFADEITLEFSRIIALLKNQHRKQIIELTEKLEEIQLGKVDNQYMTASHLNDDSGYEYDYEVLGSFYDYFRGDYPLSYWQIDGYKFKDTEERKQLVNLTIWDYVNRIRTFANKYLQEIYPEEVIPRVMHDEPGEPCETFEPIVFIYNNLELIIAKMKTTDEEGNVVKQRLNIRSALRKLNEFKQATEMERKANADNYIATPNPFESADIFESNKNIEEAFKYYLHYHFKGKKLTKTQISKIFNMLDFLWRRFYSDYEKGRLPKDLSDDIDKDDIVKDTLVNIYNHIDMLDAFLAMMRAQATLDKTWKDLQVVLDIFAEFVNFAKNYK